MAKRLSKGTSEKWQDPESNVSSWIPESATFKPSTMLGDSVAASVRAGLSREEDWTF